MAFLPKTRCKFAGSARIVEEPQNAARLRISIECRPPTPTYRACVGAVVPVRSLFTMKKGQQHGKFFGESSDK